MTIAIIGAGMAGLTCATRLAAEGHTVTVFDKGRGPGGRMATRRAEVNGETLHFDHGAQYLTAKDERFAQQVADWETAAIVARWPAAGSGCYVGVPGMNAPIKAMAADVDVHFGKRIDAFGRSGDHWRLDGDGSEDLFDTILVAVPAEQAGPLLAAHVPDMARLAEETIADPCWTMMVAFESALDHGDTIRDAGAIGWAARNSAKPGRDHDAECWVVQASPDWSREYLEEMADAVIPLLLEELRAIVGGELPAIRHSSAHRWRYARSGSAGEGALWNKESRIGVCGDWLIGPRIEHAFISGLELADKVLADG